MRQRTNVLRGPALTGLAATVALLCIAFGLHITHLATLPPGLSSDEAASAIDGLQISRHAVYPLYEDFGRPDPLYELILAVGVAAFGPQIFVIRLISAWIGIVTVAAACWAARQCAPDWPHGVRWLIGVTAAAILAISLSHITLSRSVYRGIVQPLFLLLFIGFALRGVTRSVRGQQAHVDFAWAGLSLGAALYTYTAAFGAPLAFGALALSLFLFARRQWRRWLPGLIVLGVAFTLVAVPLGLRILSYSPSVLGRAGDVSQKLITDTSGRIERLIGQFFVRGDPNPQYNTASAPLLPPLFGSVFAFGLLALLLRFRQPSAALLAALLALEGLPVLATDEVPHGLRIAGEFAVYPLISGLAIGLAAAWLLRQNLRRLILLGVVALSGLMVVDATWAYQTYVGYWRDTGTIRIYDVKLPVPAWFFRTDRQALGRWLAAQTTPLLVPVDELNETTTRAWLMARYPTVTATSDSANITLPSNTHVVVPWALELGDLRRATREYALLKDGTITILPPLSDATHATLLDAIDTASAVRDEQGGLLARVEPLPAGFTPNFEARTTRNVNPPPLAIFDNSLTLAGWRGPDTLTPGTTHLTYTLDWQPRAPTGHYYSSFLQLQTQEFQRIAGDDVLIWRWLYPASLWQPGDTVPDTHSFDVPANLPPGAYRLVAGLYVFADRRIPAIGVDGTPIGDSVTIGWVKVPPTTDASVPSEAHGLDVNFGFKGGVFILRAASATVDAQRNAAIRLFWQTTASRPAIDATVFVHLLGADGSLVAQQDARPHDGQYPTYIWDAGEMVVTDYHMPIPSNVDPAALHVQLGMYTFPSLARLPAVSDGAPARDNAVDLGTLGMLAGLTMTGK
ncbi:MAG: ArnT family glycosyltransferase [Aggregatilineales bacterium]